MGTSNRAYEQLKQKVKYSNDAEICSFRFGYFGIDECLRTTSYRSLIWYKITSETSIDTWHKSFMCFIRT